MPPIEPQVSEKASIIIPARNAAGTIEGCLGGLLNQLAPQESREIIVVDDGSTDDTLARLKGFPVRVLTQARLGPAAARNRGALAANFPLLLFTDADCVPAQDWQVNLTAPFDDPTVVGAKGVYRTRQTEPLARFVQIEYEEKYARLSRQSAIDFIDTYCAAYRRDVFLQAGGFDEGFPSASVEDQELSFRLAAQNRKMVFAPEAWVFHRHPTTVSAYARRKFFIGYWKVRVGRRHPSKMVSDAHTPPTLKLQVVLAILFVIALALGMVWTPAFLFLVIAALLFVLSAIPLLRFVHTRDPALVVRSLFYVVVRSLSLGAGLIAGVFAEIARSERLKRIVDVVGAVLGIVVLAPIMLAIAIAIRADSQGAIIFKQTRAGKDGVPFRLFKFRTMLEGAEEQLPDLANRSLIPPPLVKTPDDPRVTNVGRVLRRTSLDELPQLWNVLKGDMALVGPRPEEINVVAKYNDWQRRRLAVKPGMTGPMQVNGRALLPLDERVALELDYIQNYSLLEDMRILVRTIPAVLAGKGSY